MLTSSEFKELLNLFEKHPSPVIYLRMMIGRYGLAFGERETFQILNYSREVQDTIVHDNVHAW